MSELIDNRARRIAALKDVIQHLHQGEAPNAVREQLRKIVRETDAGEIMAMEQELIAGGMPVEEVLSMCDLHSQVTRDVLVQLPAQPLAPGHPIDTFRRENAAVREVLHRLRNTILIVNTHEDGADCKDELLHLRQAANELMDIDKHYQRKEHALFPFLEQHGITGPSKVMWAKDDEIRAALKRFNQAAHDCIPSALACKQVCETFAAPAFAAMEEMIYKEENILLPMAQQTLTENEWGEVWAASEKYGWCLVDPQTGYKPPQNAGATTPAVPTDGSVMMPTGHVTVEQLTNLLSTLPLDLTFVDADDRVAFFTEGPDRIFARSKAIVGRKVQHCHPPNSVDVVDRILNDFRAGKQNVAEFWIELHGKFVHIRYLAVRDTAGTYLGTVELTQDIAPLRALQGERRLLQY